MNTTQQKAVQGLTVQIVSIRYALKGIAHEREEVAHGRHCSERPAEALSFAADLLDEAAKSLNTVAGGDEE